MPVAIQSSAPLMTIFTPTSDAQVHCIRTTPNKTERTFEETKIIVSMRSIAVSGV